MAQAGPRIYQEGIHLIREVPGESSSGRSSSAGARIYQDGIHLINLDREEAPTP